MKNFLSFGLALGLLLPVLMGCASQKLSPPSRLSLTEDDFRKADPHQTKQVTLKAGEQLIVELGANPTTGFSWGEKAAISDSAVVRQVQHQVVASKTTRVGAGGSQLWTFEALKPGAATLSFRYDRPWAGGEKGVWTLNVIAKVE